MTRIGKLEQEILKLSRNVAAIYMRWLARFDAAKWDRKFEKDVKAGKLDRLADEVISEHVNHHTKRTFGN